MKTYVTGNDLREALRGERSVWVEVEVDLLASLMGQRVIGPDGSVISMEQVSIYRAENGVLAAEPVILRQAP